MHAFISFDLKITPAANAEISVLSSAALYGKGIFTTIAIYDGKPFLWEMHWRRLRDNAAKLRIDLGELSDDSIRRSLDEIVEKNSLINGRARITIFDESSSRIWQFDTKAEPSLLITTAEVREKNEDLKLGISGNSVYSASPLARIKSCSYADNLLAYEDARRHGVDEEVRVNERGEIVSACLANIFWLKDGGLFTPSLKTGCLPGITREFILKNLSCSQVEVGPGHLHIADSIFLTSAGLGVAEVREFQGLRFSRTGHEILNVIP